MLRPGSKEECVQAAIFCVLKADRIREAATELRLAGVPDRAVSVLCSDVPALETAYSDHAGSMMPNATSLMLAGIGPCVVSGPVAHMLAGTPAGQLVSGLTAAPADLGRLMGIRDSGHAGFLHDLKAGRGIVLVHYDTARHKDRIQSVFRDLGIPEEEIHGAGAPTRATHP
jgi:hypothetical protein